MSAYKEFSGKTVEEALQAARDEFGAELNDLDFEILTPGSRGVLGHGRRARPDRRRTASGARRSRPEARCRGGRPTPRARRPVSSTGPCRDRRPAP